MNTLNSRQMLSAIDESLEESSRWPRLLRALGFDMEQGRPGPPLLNNAIARHGFRRVLDETEPLEAMFGGYPDRWWFAIAQEVTGNRDASVDAVLEALANSLASHAAQ